MQALDVEGAVMIPHGGEAGREHWSHLALQGLGVLQFDDSDVILSQVHVQQMWQ